MKKRIERLAACVIVIMTAIAIGTGYEERSQLKAQMWPELCSIHNTGNVCQEITRCWLFIVCRTDYYRYPDDANPPLG